MTSSVSKTVNRVCWVCWAIALALSFIWEHSITANFIAGALLGVWWGVALVEVVTSRQARKARRAFPF